jgi:thioredoxin-related protein
VARDLRRELAAAQARGRALVVMVSLHGCPYCKVVRESHLLPLHGQGQPVVQVDMGSTRPVIDFEGRATTHERLIASWSIGLAPTLLFFGQGSREAAPRLVGAGIPDFYGSYLEERLLQASRRS